MKRIYVLSTILILTTGAACQNEMSKSGAAAEPGTGQSTATQSTVMDPGSGKHAGTVVEFINAGNYTYVQVDTGGKKIWAATPAFQVNVGDKVIVPAGMPMQNYHSQSLGRTFDLVYFVPNVAKEGSSGVGGELPEGHPAVASGSTGAPAVAEMNFSGIIKPQGGKTVAEIYKERLNLSGKEIVVRGKVVKYNSRIMGKNWIHLKDGTGSAGSDDLLVTSSAEVKVGDTILARGVVATDKEYGGGYKYSVIMEDAKITVE